MLSHTPSKQAPLSRANRRSAALNRLRRAARSVSRSTGAGSRIEPLESRVFLSGTIALVNPDGLPASNRLIFNTIQHPNTTFPNAVHNTNPLKIENTGTDPLTINSVNLSGPFSLVNAPAGNYAGTIIPAGGSLTITVQFTQSTVPAHSVNQTNYTTNTNGGAYITGSVTIASSDTVTPASTVTLAGYWQNLSENNEEPNLTTIVNNLAGYGTVISNPYAVDLTETTTPRLYGSEIYSDSWTTADSSSPVTVTELAEFHTEGNVVHSYWYNAVSQSSHLLFSSLSNEGQTLLPQTSSGADFASSFTPNGNFGFRVDNEYSSDAINNANGNTGGGGHHFRFYPLVDASGNAVANTWIVAMDYAVVQTENFDFQDNVFIVSNMRPATTPPSPTNFTATSGAAPVLSWTGVTYTPLGGYNVYRGTSATGPFTKLTASPISTTTYTDSTATGGQTLYYEVTAVDGTSLQESQPATVTANTPGGPVAANDSVTAFSGQATPINVLGNDTDTTGAIKPASVVVVTNPSHGGVSINSQTGTITYTSAANFTGTDTFTYTEQDSNNATSNAATVTITVSGQSTASPTASDDSALTLFNTAVIVPVLSNDEASTTLNLASLAIGTNAQHGSTTVNSDGTITYTPASNFVGSDSFTYSVADNNGKSAAATVDINVGVLLSAAAGGYKTVYYGASNGVATAITINSGTADVYFNGNGSPSIVKKKLNVSGSGLTVSDIVLNGTTARSSLNMTATKNGPITVGNISDSGSVGTINGRTVNLGGNLSVGGLNSLTLNTINASTMTIGGGIATTAIQLGVVTGASLSSSAAIRSLRVTSWSSTTADNGTISVTATSLASLVSTGNFDANIALSGAARGNTLGTARIGGSLGLGYWAVTGSAGPLVVGATGTSWGASFTGTLNSLTVRSGGLPDDIIAGAINGLSITGNLTGNITAGSANNIVVKGNVSGSTMTFTSTNSRHLSLANLTATGSFTNSTLTTAGSTSGISVAGIVNSLIDIGSTATSVTTASSANVGSATLASLRVLGRGANAFSDSSVIANTINSATTGQVNASNGGTPEGIAVVTIKSAVVGADGGVTRLSRAQLTDEATLTGYLNGKGLSFGDFRINIGPVASA